MMLTNGSRLGPYEIVTPLGAGGMGEVYKARDTRLDRTVAIKVLPSIVASDPDVRQRFEREARAVAALSHPHICTLHDIGNQDGTDYLVMEYLEGETLAERLAKGALPLDQALRYGIEIADALDRAHRAGIVHRDLKPGNIMLTKGGAKLLDFGLAKTGASVVAGTGLSMLPTTPPNLTAQGTILGTFQYMAPEQLEGQEADARTDIFAFGAVLYEMLAGKKAFEGKSQATLIAAIIERDPPSISSLQPLTPRLLDHIVTRCLAKESDERWQSAADLMRELKWVRASGLEARPPAGEVLVYRRRARLATVVAVLFGLTVSGFAGVSLVLSRRAQPLEVTRFIVVPPDGMRFDPARSRVSVISPDGRQIAMLVVGSDAQTRLAVRSFDSVEAQVLPGTESALNPSWSPDSRRIAFASQGKLKSIEATGGPVQIICDTPDGFGGSTWSTDGTTIVFASPTLLRVAASGGTPIPVSSLDESRREAVHNWPHFLPDGRHFLFLATSSEADKSAIFVGSLDSSDRKLIMNGDSEVEYAAPGYLLFLRGRALMAHRFDATALELSGEPVQLADDVARNAAGASAFSVSNTGILSHRSVVGAINTQLTWFDRTGNQVGVLGDRANYGDVELSPDEARAAVTVTDEASGTRDIWLFDISRELRTRFTFDPDQDLAPTWSATGDRILFDSNRKGTFDLYEKAANGAGNEMPVLEGAENQRSFGWSKNGQHLLYQNWTGGRDDLWVLPMVGERKPFPFLQTPFTTHRAKFSPDGRWVAYTSDESGRLEVYVMPFPSAEGKWQISTGGGSWSRWRGDGREIFYLAPDNSLMAVEVNGQDRGFVVGATRSLFQTRALAGQRYAYDVSSDGQRLLINTIAEDAAATPITIVMNWTALIDE